MHRVVPDLILENYRRGLYHGEFPTIALFLDLSGFSTMTDVLMQQGQHGAEVLAGLMHTVFDPLVDGIFAYGGKIISFAGDGILALFPIESSEKSSALTALAAAWDIQQTLGENPEHETVYGKFRFSVKIGLAFGTVSWGILHSQDRQQATYYFRGTPVDVSAAAEKHASAGEILITDELNELLKNEIEATPFGPFHKLHGFRVAMPVPTPTALDPIDLEAARIFIPEKIIVQDVRGEFRQIVNLFMRFPDLPNEQLDQFFYIIFDLHKKYGGLLNRLDFGDKGCNMLMLWGAPVAYENDIRRALNFILDLQSRVTFPITAGITYYVAHAGYLGSVMCEDYTCYGWGVNLASRFMMSAPQGKIWVDDRIARRVATRFEIENVGEQRFKGFSAEQKVNLLKGHKREAEAIYLGELVGRENELAALESFTDPLWNGNFAGMLLVLGDAGTGKGRLVHDFRASEVFEKHYALWALCQADQLVRQSFNPFRSWLFRYFGFASANNVDDRKQIFVSKLQALRAAIQDETLAQELDRLHFALGALLDLRWIDSPYEQMDAEGRHNNTILGLIALIKAESLRQPLILFIEDMQFIDHDTLQFLPRLKRTLLAGQESYPVGIIATSRVQPGNPITEGLIDSQIELGGLSLEAVARLIEIQLGGVPAVELVKLVMARSEGNPYFVEQIIRYLQEEHVIEMSERGWNQVRRTRDFFVPSDLRVVLVARLDQLTQEVKDVVQTASVLGREFAISVLTEMTDEADNIERVVADAVQSEIWAPQDEVRYVFTHGLLRDAAYTMQMRARRQELHKWAVLALEKIYADELKFHYPELAYHAERANLHQKAQEYFLLAGQASAEVYSNSQAIDYFTQALTFTPADDVAGTFELLAERAALFHRVGDRIRQLRDIESLEQLAKEPTDLNGMARVEMLKAYYCFATGDYLSLIDHARRVMDLNIPMNAEMAMDTYSIWSLGLLRLGRLDAAMEIAQDGLDLAQASRNIPKQGSILNSMGLIALEQKNPAVGRGYFELALSIAREVSDQRLEAQCLNNLGNSAGFVQGDYSAAMQYYEQANVIFRERGDRSSEGMTLNNLGWAAGMLGDFISARGHNERALLIAREVGNRYQETYTRINLSAVTGIDGDAQASLDYAHTAQELAIAAGELSGEAWALLYKGHALLMLGDSERARENF
ncbi:MAG TPA: AAA family ATPase, partial [Anaerolineales bacterium]|nr:AAA family ATPase [Anaerolineales bacterium]